MAAFKESSFATVKEVFSDLFIHLQLDQVKNLMDSAIFKAVWISVKRNLVSVLFPTITVLAVYTDLRHTARWKRQLAEQQDK